jgi:hypothetical protein
MRMANVKLKILIEKIQRNMLIGMLVGEMPEMGIKKRKK